MENLILLGITCSIVTLVGFYLAYLYGRKTKQFRWSEYTAIIIWPLLSVLIFAYYVDTKILILFIISSFVGFISEYTLGLVYHRTLNRRLWYYDDKFSVPGEYTSWLTIPLWGSAGIVFWFLGKIIGL
jgi:hypothetical protein